MSGLRAYPFYKYSTGTDVGAEQRTSAKCSFQAYFGLKANAMPGGQERSTIDCKELRDR